MEIPKSLKIGGMIWHIAENKSVTTEGNVFGSTHHLTQTIYLDPEITPQKKAQTLLHEAMHAAIFCAGIDRLMDDKLEHLEQEDVVRMISMLMYQVLRDNKLDFSEPKGE